MGVIFNIKMGCGRMVGMQKILWQWAGIGILSLVGWGINLIPSVTSWIPAVSIWSFAFIWFIGSVMYWSKRRRQKPKDNDGGVISSSLRGRMAEPDVLVRFGRSRLINLKGKLLIEVGTLIDTSLPTKIGSLRLEVGGRYLDEYPNPRIGHKELWNNMSGNAWFRKPINIGAKQKARLWLNADGQEWVSDEFTIDFDAHPELRSR